MRVLIISDTHGRHTAFDRAIMEAGKIDYLVHLGDTEGGEDILRHSADVRRIYWLGIMISSHAISGRWRFILARKKHLWHMDTSIRCLLV